MSDSTQGLMVIIFAFTLMAAWVTHVIKCLIVGKYVLLLAGAIVFPVGVIHGIGIWFGVSW